MKKLVVCLLFVTGLLFAFAEKPSKVNDNKPVVSLAERMDLAYANAMSLNYSTPYKEYLQLYSQYLADNPAVSAQDEQVRLRKIALDYKYGSDFKNELARVDELYPDSEFALVQKRFYHGYIAFAEKKYQKAIDYFSKVDDNNFYYLKSLYLQAACYRALNNDREAVSKYEEYITAETDIRLKHISMYDLAVFLESINDDASAKKYFSKLKGSKYLAKPQREYVDRFLRLN